MPPKKKRSFTNKKYNSGSSNKKEKCNKYFVCATEVIVDVTPSTCPPSLDLPPVSNQPDDISPETNNCKHK